jgi:hypothetical protein
MLLSFAARRAAATGRPRAGSGTDGVRPSHGKLHAAEFGDVADGGFAEGLEELISRKYLLKLHGYN